MATNSEILNNIAGRLGGRTAPTFRATVLFELMQKIYQLEQGPNPPWFLESYETGQVVIGQNYISVPTGFIREVEEHVLKVKNSDGGWFELRKCTIEDLEKATESEVNAFPQGYALVGARFYLGPTPDQNYDYKILCFKHSPQVFDNNIEASNPWLVEAYNYITLETIDIVARTHMQSSEIPEKIAAQLGQAREIFWRDVEARKHVNMDYLLTGEEN